MIRSMTGYGAAEASTQSGWNVSVECRSVNHKGLEARVHTAREWAWLEPLGKSIAKRHFSRGRVDIRVECTRDQPQALSLVDEKRFGEVASQLRELVAEHGLEGGVSLSNVLSFRDVLATQTPVEDVEKEPEFVGALEEAIAALAVSRADEGAKLVDTMESLLEQVGGNVASIQAAVDGAIEDYRGRLAARVVDAAKKFGLAEFDEARVIQEVVIYADRVAIAEEIQRAESHLSKLSEVLRDPSPSARGKKVDFYLQELMREANTMGSKTGSTSVTEWVVDMKSAIEKMREQAANIE